MKISAYYLFRKTPLPDNIGSELAAVIDKLKRYDTKEAYLKESYNLITTRYESGRLETIKLHQLWSRNLNNLWNRKGFLHCTNQNYLLALILVSSGFFTEKDITPKWTLIGYFFPHQYLKIRLRDNQWVTVDCWGRHYGIPYGNHAHGFKGTVFRSFVA